MNNRYLNKIVTIIIYSLTGILTILVLYNIALILNKNFHSSQPPRNSIKVSPISDEKIYNVSNMHPFYKVNYKNVQINNLISLSKASIIYDTYNQSNNSSSYSALFLDDDLIRDDSMLTIYSIPITELPNITFIDNSNLKDYSYLKLINNINITNTDNCYLNFFYYNGRYNLFTKSSQDRYPILNKTTTYQNIIIDVTSQKDNLLYVYSGGLFRSYINGDNLFLSKGKTYWCTLNKYSSLNFTFLDSDNKIQVLTTYK